MLGANNCCHDEGQNGDTGKTQNQGSYQGTNSAHRKENGYLVEALNFPADSTYLPASNTRTK